VKNTKDNTATLGRTILRDAHTILGKADLEDAERGRMLEALAGILPMIRIDAWLRDGGDRQVQGHLLSLPDAVANAFQGGDHPWEAFLPR
jgi:hypothetical protein